MKYKNEFYKQNVVKL